MPSRKDAIKEAQAAAIREVERRQLDPSEPVDVFGVVEDHQVWLAFLPLDRLFGMYVNHPGSPGIGIHSGHPAGTQRFTAAHELGHHLLGHSSVGDTRPDVFGGRSEIAEQQAQAFASEFVMPTGHVYAAKRRIGAHNSDSLAWPQIYAVALELATSFEATAVRAQQLRLVPSQDERPAPKVIKQGLLDGSALANPWADVWTVSPETARTLRPNVDDVVVVSLSESPSTGYRWHIDADGDLLEVAHDTMVKSEGPDTHVRRLHFRVVGAGSGVLGATLRRAWEDTPVDAFGCTVAAAEGRHPRGVRAHVGQAHAKRRAA